MGNQGKKLIIILGPTAAGKTSLAVDLAVWLDTEIVSADSRQVYREMSIGTAKPSAEQLKAVKHHLVGHVSVTEPYNAGRYEKDALACLQEIFKYRDHALLAGGSGLYIRALCHGLDELPDSDPLIRNWLQSAYEKFGIGYLQGELKDKDPDYYRIADLSNPSRLIRALEVFEITGVPYYKLRKGIRAERDFRAFKIGLFLQREELVRRIQHRTDGMIQSGLLEEVRSLLPYRRCSALNTVGYRELFDFLDGKSDLETAVEKIKTNTRRYAKRQMTWFRKDNEIAWFAPEEGTEITDYIKSILSE